MATERQKIAAKKVSENIRNPSSLTSGIGSILKQSGYSESVSKSPQRVTESKGWRELMSELLPDEELLQLHRALLAKEEIIRKGRRIISQPHRDVVRALDLAYKLKGAYASEPAEEEGQDLRDVPTSELLEMLNLEEYGYFKEVDQVGRLKQKRKEFP